MLCGILLLYMIADFHNDVLTTEFEHTKKIAKELTCSVCALFRGGRNFEKLREIARRFTGARPENLFLGLEDIGYINDVTGKEILEWGPIYASLTWNGENELAGGCFCDGGLTVSGKRAVAFLSEHRIAIDCAHLNGKSFREMLNLEPYAVIDSHTCLSGVYGHPRNLEDWQVREIISRGGLIGIAFVGKFLGEGTVSEQDIFRHIDYGVQKFGIDYFCFGSDFFGTSDLPIGIHGYSDIPNLKKLFEKAGYGATDIEKIFALNLKNFLAKKKEPM